MAINYQDLVSKALRSVLKDALMQVIKQDEICLYISFATNHAGVVLSENLRRENPEEMTIVLEHQFQDLQIKDDQFKLTLFFGGKPESITIPYSAIISYIDEKANFALDFDINDEQQDSDRIENQHNTEDAQEQELSNVIFLDQFRK